MYFGVFNHTNLFIEKFCIFNHACLKLIIVLLPISSLILRPPAFHHHFKYNPPFIILVLVTLEKWLGAWK